MVLFICALTLNGSNWDWQNVYYYCILISILFFWNKCLSVPDMWDLINILYLNKNQSVPCMSAHWTIISYQCGRLHVASKKDPIQCAHLIIAWLIYFSVQILMHTSTSLLMKMTVGHLSWVHASSGIRFSHFKVIHQTISASLALSARNKFSTVNIGARNEKLTLLVAIWLTFMS